MPSYLSNSTLCSFLHHVWLCSAMINFHTLAPEGFQTNVWTSLQLNLWMKSLSQISSKFYGLDRHLPIIARIFTNISREDDYRIQRITAKIATRTSIVGMGGGRGVGGTPREREHHGVRFHGRWWGHGATTSSEKWSIVMTMNDWDAKM